jgi:lipase ATG15
VRDCQLRELPCYSEPYLCRLPLQTLNCRWSSQPFVTAAVKVTELPPKAQKTRRYLNVIVGPNLSHVEMLPTPFHVLLLVLALPIPVAPTQFPFQQPDKVSPSPITLYLRHLHVADTGARRVLFADVPPEPRSPHAANGDSDPRSPYTLDTVLQTTHRPSSLAAHAHARKAAVRLGKGLHNDTTGELTWEEDVIASPDVTRRETLIMLAKMTSNAYLSPDDDEWYDLEGKWNVVSTIPSPCIPSYNGNAQSYPIGWEEDGDGLRGYVFASADNKTVALSIKGTSSGFFGGGGPTAPKDKMNDNLLFSCCCAKVGFSWTPVCGCWAGGWTCDRDCLEESLWTDDSFYPVGAVCLILWRRGVLGSLPSSRFRRICITISHTCILRRIYGL